MAEKNQTLELWDNHGELILTGSSNAYIAETARPIVGYFRGLRFCARANHTNTGAATINVNGIGATAIRKGVTTALASGDIVSGKYYDFIYDDANSVFQIFAVPDAGSIGTAELEDESVTYAKMQHVSATSRVLGRKTAGAGDVEECTLSEVLDFVGSAAQGDILYRGASSWTRLPAGTSGNFLQTQGAAANPQWATAGGVTAGTAQATTSGTAFDFTGLPAGINRITVIFDRVSLDGSSEILVQIGDAGGIETTGYESGAAIIVSSVVSQLADAAGFNIMPNNAARGISGLMTIARVTGNVWVASHAGGFDTPLGLVGGGRKELSGELTQVRVTTAGDDFDAGQVNIFYE